MTKRVVCAVRDVVADSFGPPFTEVSVGAGERAFMDAVNRNDPTNLMSQHPEHFELYLLGDYDINTGRFDLLPNPRQLVSGVGVAKSKS